MSDKDSEKAFQEFVKKQQEEDFAIQKEDKQRRIERGNFTKEDEKLADDRAFNLQCFLVNYMEEFAKRKNYDTYSDGSNYKSFAMLSGPSGDILQEFSCTKGVGELFNLSSAQKSLLVPKIQIFKIVYENGSSKSGKDVSLPFKSHLSEYEIASVMKDRKGRGDDVGIKSFSYELSGKTPGQEGMITCDLSLFFTNANSFLEKREKGLSFSDLIWDKDLVSPSGVVYNSKNFRTKIVFGWHVPSDAKNTLFSIDLIKSIERSSIVLYLTRKGEDLEFVDNGTLQVTIHFVGALEGIMSDNDRANIFIKSEAGIEAENRKKKLSENEKKEIKEQKERGGSDPKIDNSPQKVKRKYKECGVEKTPWYYGMFGYSKAVCKDVEVEEDAPNQKEQEKLYIADLEAIDKQEKYSRILRELFDHGQMYYIDIDENMVKTFDKQEEEAIKIRLESQKNNVSQRDIKKSEIESRNYNIKSFSVAEKIKRVMSEEERNQVEHVKKVSIEAINKGNESNATFNKEYKMENKGIGEGEKTKIRSVLGMQISSALTWEKTKNEKIVRSYFFYFGDLLDILFSNYVLDRTDVDDNLRILVGSLIYKDPNPNSQKQIEINIADIPISLERFIAWYSKKVIASQTEIYTVGNFIKDILRDVIIGTLGENCFGTTSKNLPQIQFNTMSIPMFGKNEPLYWVKNGMRTDIRSKPKYDLDVLKKNENIDPKNLQHYIYLFAMNYALMDCDGDYKKDISRGIYHLAPGMDRGLVKSIKFSKESLAYVPEMNVESQGREGNISDGVYKASIRMVGNNLFRNGANIYIDTSKMGMGVPMYSISKDNKKYEKLSFVYHIGGYYNILKVVNEYTSDGDYETILEAKCQNARDGSGVGFTVVGNERNCSTPVSQQTKMSDGKDYYSMKNKDVSIDSPESRNFSFTNPDKSYSK